MKFEQLLFDLLHGFGYSLSDSIDQSLWSLGSLNSLMYTLVWHPTLGAGK